MAEVRTGAGPAGGDAVPVHRAPLAVLRVAAGAGLLAGVLLAVGREPFAAATPVLRPLPVAAALVLGVVAAGAQALRWRAVLRAHPGAGALTRRRALAEYLRATALDALLPSGLAGSAARAVRGRGRERGGLRASAAAVVGERAVGVALLLGAAAAVLVPFEPVPGALVAAGAAAALAVAAPSLRRLDGRTRLAVVGWSVLGLAPLALLFVVAAAHVLPDLGGPRVLVLAVAALAGMAVPVGLAGFGPREAVTASAAAVVGLAAADGVTAAVAYGLLVAVSALPGVAVLGADVVRTRPRGARRGRGG